MGLPRQRIARLVAFVLFSTSVVALSAGPAQAAVDVSVLDTPYSAAGDGAANDRAAIQSAIDDVTAAGGGTVTLPGGHTYLTGNLILKSNVRLEVATGAVLLQSQNVSHYADTPVLGHEIPGAIQWNGAQVRNHPLVYAGNAVNVKITGGGVIRGTYGGSDSTTIHVASIGLYQVDGFEISGVTIDRANGYYVAITSSNDGSVHGITTTNPPELNTDGVSIQNSQDIDVYGNTLTTGDDGIYVWSSYNDPRGTTWWSSAVPEPTRNIEIYDNTVTVNCCKAIAFIAWGAHAPDLTQVEISDINVHDNVLTATTAVGCWCDEPYGTPPAGARVPIKNVTFARNTYNGPIAFADPLITNLSTDFGKTSPDVFTNAGFEGKTAYWSQQGASADSGTGADAVGQDGSRYGFIRDFTQDTALYQGLALGAGEYTFTARVQSSGATLRLFVSNPCDGGAVVASRTFANTAWATLQLPFIAEEACPNYHLGIDDNGAASGWGRIDSAALPPYSVNDDTILDNRTSGIEVINTDGIHEYNLGTVFQSTVDGHATALRVYAAPGESGDHIAYLFNNDTGTAQGPWTWTYTGDGTWKTFTLPTPVPISAANKYTVSISTGTDSEHVYPATPSFFTAPGSNNNVLTWFKSSGVYGPKGSARPASSINDNGYYRDIVFEPGELPDPDPDPDPEPGSIFGEVAGISPISTDGDEYNLGTVFQSTANGQVTALRVYAAPGESGDHTAYLFDNTSNTTFGPWTWTYTGDGTWKTFTLPTPVPISAANRYTVSVSTGTDTQHTYPAISAFFTASGVNGSLTWLAGAGVFGAKGSARPTSSYNNNSYFRDVVFEPAS